jgi:hypothetical protein
MNWLANIRDIFVRAFDFFTPEARWVRRIDAIEQELKQLRELRDRIMARECKTDEEKFNQSVELGLNFDAIQRLRVEAHNLEIRRQNIH